MVWCRAGPLGDWFSMTTGSGDTTGGSICSAHLVPVPSKNPKLSVWMPDSSSGSMLRDVLVRDRQEIQHALG